MERILPAALLTFGCVLGLGAASGGWDATTWGWAAVALCAVAAATAILEPRRPRGLPLVFFGGIAAVTAWTALSAVWSDSVPSTMLEVERDLVYLAAVAAALLLRRGGIEDGVLAACVVVCGWNLISRLQGYDHRLAGADASPIGYANGLGLVAAIGIVLAARRLWTLPALGVLVPVLVFVHSDGSWLALVCGLLVASSRRLAPLAALAAVVAVLVGIHGHERSRYWDVALADAGAHPALGSGAGTYAEQWVQRRSVPLDGLDAHSLELETLAELGVVGLVLLGGTLVLPYLRGSGAALGAYTAWVVQSGIDWEWELPAVTLAGLFCAVAAMRREEPREVMPAGVPARVLAVALSLGVGVLALVGLLGNSALDRARAALRIGDTRQAETEAATARRWAPWSAEPWRIVSQGRGGDVAALRRAVELDPGDWSLWAELAAAAPGAEGRRAAARAARLNPFGSNAPG